MSDPLQDAFNRFKVTQGAATKRQNNFASTPKDKRGEFISGVNAAAGVIPPATPELALLPSTVEGRQQGAAAGKSFIDKDGSTWANDQAGGFNVQKPDGSALAPSSDYGDGLLSDFQKQYPNGVWNADDTKNEPIMTAAAPVAPTPIGSETATAAPIPIAPDPNAAPPVDPNANYGFTPAPAESPELTAAKAKAQESIAAFTPAPVEAPVVVNGFIADPADRAARGLPLLPADALAPTETPVEPTKPVNPITETGIDRLDLDPSVEGNGIGMVNPETGDPLMSIEGVFDVHRGVDSTRNNQALLPAGMAASDPTGSGQFKAIGGDGKMVLVSTQEEADRLNQNEYDIQAADKIAHQKFLASPEAAAMTKRQMQPTAYDIASQDRMNALQPMERDGGLSGAARDTAAANGRTDRTSATEQLAPDAGKKSERTIKANVIAQRNGWIQADTPERAEAYIQLEQTNIATSQIEGFDAQISAINTGYETLREQALDATANSFSGFDDDFKKRVDGQPVMQALMDVINGGDAELGAKAKSYMQSIEQLADSNMLNKDNQFGAQAAQYREQIQYYNQGADKVAFNAGITRQANTQNPNGIGLTSEVVDSNEDSFTNEGNSNANGGLAPVTTAPAASNSIDTDSMSPDLQDQFFDMLGNTAITSDRDALYQIANGVDYSPEQRAEARALLGIKPPVQPASPSTQWAGGGAGLQVNPW
jgi:hypothetical protein